MNLITNGTLYFCSKSSVLLGLSLTVPLMVACLSVAIPIWIRNGYRFWVSRVDLGGPVGNYRTLWMKEVRYPPVCHLFSKNYFTFIYVKLLQLLVFFKCCQGVILSICISIFVGSVLALGAIVSAKPLEDLGYKGWAGGQNSIKSPYASSVYLGWAMASVIALIVTGLLPIASWFATYRFTLSSAICVAIFAGN